MEIKYLETVYDFSKQSTYEIIVEGKVDPTFMENLNDLVVTHTEIKNKTLSSLKGILKDQEALSGILNILFDHRYPVISVMKLE